MKRFLSLALAATMLTTASLSCKKKTTVDPTPSPAAFMASTTPSNRIAVLEDFTGVRCGYCVDGHVRAKAILDANPGKFIVIATHANLYAKPTAGWADFTTTAGTAIDAQAKPSGYPAGTMNRMPCTTMGTTAMSAQSTITMGRGEWSKAATAVMGMSAPVNLGASATFDATSRKLTIKVDLYYTAAETSTNNLCVALLQDKLLATQSNYTAGAQNPTPNYEQNHVLRDMITTGSFGEPITETTAVGSKVSKTYTYTVPADYHGTTVTGGGAVDIANCKVVAYVTRGQFDILNAIEIPIK